MSSAFAVFDYLFIVNSLGERLGSAAGGEVHLFAYLACLLSLLDGQPSAEWGYAFSGLEMGSPFSADLYESAEELERLGMLRPVNAGFLLTDSGTERLIQLESLEFFRPRLKYLVPSCQSLLAFPVGMIRNAMSMEPGLRPVIRAGGSRPLLGETTLEQLHEYREALTRALGKTADLLVPATVWLKYLSDKAAQNDAAKMSLTLVPTT
ncbi:MAG TPA: hypothetical protein VFQ41_19775 [Candidatus Angelobacter sp.]|nr:hypothetical protein [Candidatus Angelobacter sp.]